MSVSETTKMAEQVIFRKGEADDSSDIWDDTALIKAYDNAIKVMKTQVSKEPNTDPDVEKRNGKKKKNRRKQQKSKNDSDQQKCGQWAVGDSCRAVFVEDGLPYEAVIRAVEPVTRSCVVRYRSYGNEEEQRLDDLMPSALSHEKAEKAHSASDAQSGYSEKEYESGMEWQPPASPASRATHRSPLGRGRATSSHGQAPPPFLPPPPHSPSAMPPMFSPWSGNAMGGMTIPPPPPPMPPIPSGGGDEDNEALYSMLMAWYMSGFHTGYYQGKKAAQKTSRPGNS